jgi:hypothetical protein
MRTRTLALLVIASASFIPAVLAACGDDSSTPSNHDGGSDGGPGATTDGTVAIDGTTGNADTGTTGQDGGEDASVDGSDAGTVDRGPSKYLMQNVPAQASPDGLFWQYGADPALYVADEGNNTIVRWDDKKGFSKGTGALPDELAPDSGGLGQVIRLEDGTFFVTRFGFGTGGGIIYVAATGDAGYFPGLDVTRKRIGLGLNPDGTLTTTYFKGMGSNTTGAVAKLSAFTGGEKDFITNLTKPVGVSYLEGRVVATDQTPGYVVQSTAFTIGGQFQDPADGGPDAGGYDAGSVLDSGLPDTFALLAGGDAICQGPDGSIFAATNTGTVYQIARDGTVKAVPGATGLVRTKGVAYDGANKRLFVGEIDTTNGSSIHIYPIN